ncbi:uncharacterized protein DDB_G0280205-like isoform X1 [Sipha flava]|uniref:Uncharacterized protein DDB_G0280205-like isoform X1 n=2 Tax=Sipha flava TaxID=143950 RepID=A0A8B8F3A6_9HEMI|nr:uncharacterized protein DDB_G0280205-like isoform X1 [Sipha flava]
MMFKYMCLVLFITWYQLADCHPANSDAKLIDSMIEKESEAFIAAEAEQSSHKTIRDKRTIGFLRQLFPNLSQIVDRKIQQITRFLFRVIGRLVLRGGAGGGAGGGAVAGGGGGGGGGGDAGGSGGRRISITLPTFPPSTDDEDEEQTEVPAAVPAAATESPAAGTTPSSVLASDTVSATDSAPAESAVDVVATTSAGITTNAPMITTITAATTTAATTNTAADNAVTTISITTTTTTTTTAASSTNADAVTQPPSDSDNTVGTGIVKRTAREVSTEKTSSAKKRSPLTDTENVDVTSSDNTLSSGSANDEARSDDTILADDDEDPKNKRVLFNLRGGGSGGSGNILFDMIRRGADRAARAAGGFYRVVAGTDPNTLTLAQPLQYPSLIAGSGANQDKDEVADGSQLEGAESQEVRTDVNAKEDGYSVGVPGPLTRIFVIANRGVANLVQDLILRLAQTTERIVNFKARLITSLI